MALTVTPSQPVSGIKLVTYSDLDSNDTAQGVKTGGTEPIVGCVQAFGTFGGATVALQGSNDGTNWVNLNDVNGVEIALTAADGAEFTSSFIFIRPDASGGSGDSITVLLVTRG